MWGGEGAYYMHQCLKNDGVGEWSAALWLVCIQGRAIVADEAVQRAVAKTARFVSSLNLS